MEKHTFKKFLSIMLCVIMVLSGGQLTALAEEWDSESSFEASDDLSGANVQIDSFDSTQELGEITLPEVDDPDFGFSNDFLVEGAEVADDSLESLAATDSSLPEISLGEGDLLVGEDLFEAEAAEEAFTDGLVGDDEEPGNFYRLQIMLEKVKDDLPAAKAVLYRDYVAEEEEPWIVIPEGITTIDLNGHTINRNLENPAAKGAAIYVPSGSELILIDSVGGGKVTGGNSTEAGGGILNEGTLTLGENGQGPAISGNKATDGAGIMNRGTLLIHDALISENTASESGGGILVTGSSVFQVEAGPVVTGNSGKTGNDIHLLKEAKINLIGALTEGAKLSVSIADDFDFFSPFTQNYTAQMGEKNPVDYFVPEENQSIEVKNGEACLVYTTGEYLIRWEKIDDELSFKEYLIPNAKDLSPVSSLVTSLPSGWYTFSKNKTYARRLNIIGDVNLIIPGDITVTANQGIHVPEGSSLTIYGQFSQGKLIANSPDDQAAIGGNKNEKSGYIEIHGPEVNCYCKSDGAGIGGGYHGAGGTTVIYGGTVHAESGSEGAGIGGGKEADGGFIQIYGYGVTAIGGKYAAGIGGGKGADGGIIQIYGKVTAQGGGDAAGIGAGKDGNFTEITIYGGEVKATGGDDGAGIGLGENGGPKEGKDADFGQITINGGDIEAHGGDGGAGIGGGNNRNNPPIVINGGTIFAYGGKNGAGIGGGDDGGSTLRSIKIYDAEYIRTNGGDNGAGIGGGDNSAASVQIYSGTIYAFGGKDTAGIGAGQGSDYAEVTISGGDVLAEGGDNGAGIGGSKGHNFKGKILITGGWVKATGGSSKDYVGGAGIGAGSHDKSDGDGGSHSGNITITGGTVIAYGGNRAAGIGGGSGGNLHGTINISGGNLNVTGGKLAYAIGSGQQAQYSGFLIDGSTGGYGNGSVNITGGEMTLKFAEYDQYRSFVGNWYSINLSVANSLCAIMGDGAKKRTEANVHEMCGRPNNRGYYYEYDEQLTYLTIKPCNHYDEKKHKYVNTYKNITEATHEVNCPFCTQKPEAHTFENGKCTVCGYQAKAKVFPEFRTHSLVLSGAIGVNFFMYLPEIEGVDYSKSYMTFKVNDEVKEDIFDPQDMDAGGRGYYGFTCLVYSLQMGEKITAQFHYGDGMFVEQSYSITDYLVAYEKVADNYGKEMTDLLHALGSYGTYAQIALANSNSFALGLKYASMDVACAAPNVGEAMPLLESYQAHKELGDTPTWDFSYALNLKSTTDLHVILHPLTDYEGDVQVTVDGSDVSAVKQEDGSYEVILPNFSAHELGQAHTVAVTASNGAASITLSPLSYASSVIKGSDDNLRTLAAALYNYYKAAENYLGQPA